VLSQDYHNSDYKEALKYDYLMKGVANPFFKIFTMVYSVLGRKLTFKMINIAKSIISVLK
jgi:hypothetical protein